MSVILNPSVPTSVVVGQPSVPPATLAIAPGDVPIHKPEHYSVLTEKIANCELIFYEGLPHNITDAVPDRCAEDYRRFLLQHRRAV